MMSLWDALRMNMMISYQELVRTFPNVSGYVAGILFSFIMNVRFTFSTSLSLIKFIKFLSVCAICYIFNLVAMKFFLTLMPQHVYTAQFIGMFFYTAIGFILNKFWSMK
ncbi:GtrA family protein [Escherichia coli]|uniref:GtrA family protein n=1 Tax=Escherichia coli TaxID=562 RepID=UPI002893818E|nr:GtrA family protein [Escherichia coli]